ncbi:MAG: thioredoxin family protein [Myxococcales bacterium]|nr:thioredoxin family protein [Myxococcales bacterium]MCB9708914.1 thioredoxin family protein [Myxococcales bacterium]
MVLTYSKGMPVGTPAPNFSLLGVDDKTYTLETFGDASALVVVFTCNHCPYAKASESRLVEIQADYSTKGVRVVAINPNDASRYPEDSLENMKIRASEQAFNFPYLYDATQEVARAYDAICTPDIFVFDGHRKLVYNGRLDDNWQQPNLVRRRDLRVAIDAALKGTPLPFEPIPSMGCSIKWKVRS